MEQLTHYPLLQTALAGVVEAATEIMAIYRTGFSANYKSDGTPVTIADLASNDILEQHLSTTGIPILTEERLQAPYDERKDWQQLWCVDPLDGTKEFIRKNDEFAINIALIEDGKPVLGIIASPVEQQVLIGGTQIPPAVLSFDQLQQIDSWQYLEAKKTVNRPIVIAGSRTPPSPFALSFFEQIGDRFGDYTYLKKGSALKFFDLARGTADIYPRFAPTMEWDIAAGQAIMEALGGSVTHPATGVVLHYNKALLLNPHFVVRTQAVREYLQAHD